jgi:hypothetical protein
MCRRHRSTQLSDAQIVVNMALDFANLEGYELQPKTNVAIPIGRASCPFYAAFRIVVQAFNNSPRFVLNSRVVHTLEQM